VTGKGILPRIGVEGGGVLRVSPRAMIPRADEEWQGDGDVSWSSSGGASRRRGRRARSGPLGRGEASRKRRRLDVAGNRLPETMLPRSSTGRVYPPPPHPTPPHPTPPHPTPPHPPSPPTFDKPPPLNNFHSSTSKGCSQGLYREKRRVLRVCVCVVGE